MRVATVSESSGGIPAVAYCPVKNPTNPQSKRSNMIDRLFWLCVKFLHWVAASAERRTKPSTSGSSASSGR